MISWKWRVATNHSPFHSRTIRGYTQNDRLNFIKLVTALKGGSLKGVGFKPAKPRNFDGVWDRKVVDVWLVEMEDYLHAAKVRRHSAMELA